MNRKKPPAPHRSTPLAAPEASPPSTVALHTPPPASPPFPQGLTPTQRKHLGSPLKKAGDTRTFQALPQAAFVWCPPGGFRLGSDDTDPEAYFDEKPAQDVTLTRGFWMQQTPVTQAQWQAITGANLSCFKNAGPNAPAEGVSWFDAVWFCNELSKKEGLPLAYRCLEENGKPGEPSFRCKGVELVATSPGYRLPTEAEWEYACRAQTTAPRYGDLDEIAWWGCFNGEGNAQVTYEGGLEEGGKSWGTHPVR